MLVVAVLAVLLGVLVMFVIAGQILENRVDDRIEEVNKDFDASLNRFRDDVRKELDARIPAGGVGTIPTPTATAAPTETPSPTATPDAGTTETPSPTQTPAATASPTETPREEIRP
jgi:type II secretory pathway pseudopilin PulG